MSEIKQGSTLKKFIFGTILLLGLSICSAVVISFAVNITYEYNRSNHTARVIGISDMPETLEIPEKVMHSYPITVNGVTTDGPQEEHTVTSIAYSALNGGDRGNLKTLKIPKTITSIDDSIYAGSQSENLLPNLIAFDVNSNNPNYYSLNGVLYNKNKTELLRCPMKLNNSSLSIPSSVTTIGDRAFQGCQMGNWSCNIPQGVTTIGVRAFKECTLTSLQIPNSVTSIGEYAFYKCSSLSGSLTIFGTVNSIGKYAFSGCSNLQSLTLKNGAGSTLVGENIFAGCTGLTSLAIENGAKLGNYMFEGCSKLENAPIPSNITSIPSGLFKSCESLKSVTLPANLTSIGNDAFEYCEGLTQITIPNSVTSIGNYAFHDCKLENVILGTDINSSCLTTIGQSAFSSNKLTGLVLPLKVRTIGTRAFASNSNIQIFIPKECTNNGEDAFGYSLTAFKYSLANNNDIIVEGVADASKAPARVNIPGKVGNYTFGQIGTNAFEGCSNIKQISIPSSVTTIGSRAFKDCTNLESITYKALQETYGTTSGYSYKIVTAGAQDIFDGCTSYKCTFVPNDNNKSIVKPDSDAPIAYYARSTDPNFAQLSNIPVEIKSISNTTNTYNFASNTIGDPYMLVSSIPTNVTISFEDMWVEIDGYTYWFSIDAVANESIVQAVFKKDPNTLFSSDQVDQFDLPAKIWGYPIKVIGAIYINAKKITIPEGVTCVGIVGLPDDGTENFKSATESVVLPESLTSVATYDGEDMEGFKNRSSLKCITIPAGVTSIGEDLFEGCSSLEVIFIPNNISTANLGIPNTTIVYKYEVLSNQGRAPEGEKLVKITNADVQDTSKTIPENITCKEIEKPYIIDSADAVKKNGSSAGSVIQVNHAYSLEHTSAVPATCSSAGNTEYWTCADCNKCFTEDVVDNIYNNTSVAKPIKSTTIIPKEIKLNDTVLQAGSGQHSWSYDYEWSNNDKTFTFTRTCSLCKEVEKLKLNIYSGTYDGQLHDAVTVTQTIPNTTLFYSGDGDNWSSTIPQYKNVGNYLLFVKLKDNKNNTEVSVVDTEINISKRAITVTADDQTQVYGKDAEPLTYTITQGSLVSGEKLNGSLSRVEGNDVGEYTITQGTLTNENNTNYNITFVPGTYLITKANTIAPTVTPYSGTYDGQPHEVEVTGVPSGRTVLYSIDEEIWSTEAPTATNVNETPLTVFVKVQGNANYEDSEIASATITINAKELADNNVSLSATEFGHTGEPQTPTVTVMDESTQLIENTDYTVRYKDSTNNFVESPTAIGTYTVIVEGQGNYTGTVDTNTFEIIETQINKPTVTSYTGTYDSQPHGVEVTDVASGRTVLYSTDQINWSENEIKYTDAGEYVVYVKVQGDASHEDSEIVSGTITINKAATAAPTVTGCNVEYNGQPHGVEVTGVPSGRTVLYSTDQDNWVTTSPTLTNVGSMTVYVKISSDANHNASSVVSAKITIREQGDYILGDINGDGRINTSDYILLYNYVKRKISLDDDVLPRADINKDGRINTSDYIILYNYVKRKIPTL